MANPCSSMAPPGPLPHRWVWFAQCRRAGSKSQAEMAKNCCRSSRASGRPLSLHPPNPSKVSVNTGRRQDFNFRSLHPQSTSKSASHCGQPRVLGSDSGRWKSGPSEGTVRGQDFSQGQAQEVRTGQRTSAVFPHQMKPR